jgi:hypothetical protein
LVRYDFDKDDYIIKEDVRLVLSHVPINNTVAGKMSSEGAFTQAGGGSQVFVDRMKNQEEIFHLCDEVFGTKTKLNFSEFEDINTNLSSEMFLSLIILLQSCLPCTENFTRYKRNYEKYLEGTGDQPKHAQAEIKQIASPRLMSSLSPLSQMGLGGLNFNPNAQKVLLQAAANRKPGENEGPKDDTAEMRAGEIPIANFKSNKLSMIDRKQRAEEL